MANNQSVQTNLTKVEEILSQAEIKFLRLTSLDGTRIVPFNPLGKSWKSRYNEIVKKMPSLPDGVYIFQGQDELAPGSFTTRVLFGKGKFETPTQEPEKKLSENNLPMLSVENAVSNIKEAERFKAENEFLKKEHAQMKGELEILKAKLEAGEYLDEEEEEEEPSSGLSWLKETVPVLLPLADRFFDMEQKKLDLQEKKFLHENGYKIPGTEKRKEKNSLPDIGSPDFEKLVVEIQDLPEDKFQSVMEQLKIQSPGHYNAILPLVWEEGEEETNSTDQ